MQLASISEVKNFLAESESWAENHMDNSIKMSAEERTLIRVGVAEYIANKQGLTMFNHNKSLKKRLLENY